MEGLGWILTIIVGALAGWIAEKLMKFDTGLLMNIVLGIVGALLANFIMINLFNVALPGVIGQLIMGIVGACILIGIYKAVKGRA